MDIRLRGVMNTDQFTVDYMDRRRVFTLDPERFPADLVKDLVDTIHSRDQHYIVMVDPAVFYKEPNPALDEGLRYDIFMKEANGTYSKSVVWAGPSYFPDWFNPTSQQYWDEQFIDFFNGANGPDIDALWIDMNEVCVSVMWNEIADPLTYRYRPANFFNRPYPGNNTTPEAFAEADNDLLRRLLLEKALMLPSLASLPVCSETSPMAKRLSVQLL
jgi:alpha-glucosidase